VPATASHLFQPIILSSLLVLNNSDFHKVTVRLKLYMKNADIDKNYGRCPICSNL